MENFLDDPLLHGRARACARLRSLYLAIMRARSPARAVHENARAPLCPGPSLCRAGTSPYLWADGEEPIFSRHPICRTTAYQEKALRAGLSSFARVKKAELPGRSSFALG